MPEKRPYSGDHQNGDPKRSRSVNGSPVPGGATNGLNDGQSEEARKKAEIAERIAAMKAKISGQAKPAPSPAQTQSATNVVEDAKARIAAMKARLNAGPPATASPSPGPQTPRPSTPARQTPDASSRQADAQAQLAALKARAAEQQYLKQRAPPPPPEREDNSSKVRGGLGIGLHPALMGNAARSGKGPGKEQNEAEQTKVNPYLEQTATTGETNDDPVAFDSRLGKAAVSRKSRAMIFNQKGKFIAQAEALRTQERLEKLKQEMQAQARKKAIEEATERSYLVQAPPDVEWWDEGLVEGSTYDHIDESGGIKFDVITEYVQHPVLIEPPQEKLMPAPKPVPLTEKERKKQRRQRRMEDHKEEQAKIRLGLIAPPPPKVKKSNLMRVLGQEAVKDPTAVEARVNREIAERADKHEADNEERKLTKEQRHEKLAAQQEGDAAKGLRVAVFRVESLSYKKHRFLIDKNAQQHGLTGMVVLHPKMNLVVIEGGAHSVNAYRKLMLNRIRWTENAAPLDRGGTAEDRAEKEREEKDWMQSLDEQGRLKDLSYNRCTLVWEGEEKQRAFRKWGNRVCETDGEAKDALARMKMENMWTLAQSLRVD